MAKKERENGGMRRRSKWFEGEGREEDGRRRGVWGDAATVRLKP